MSGYGSLFERLNGTPDQRSGWDRETSVMASVAEHLAKMLSTRAGSVQTLPDYGLPDLNDLRLDLHDVLKQACSAIKHCIDTYEPRLTNVTVTSTENIHHLRLAFAISGWLDVDGVKREIRFSAHLDGNATVQVQRSETSSNGIRHANDDKD